MTAATKQITAEATPPRNRLPHRKLYSGAADWRRRTSRGPSPPLAECCSIIISTCHDDQASAMRATARLPTEAKERPGIAIARRTVPSGWRQLNRGLSATSNQPRLSDALGFRWTTIPNEGRAAHQSLWTHTAPALDTDYRSRPWRQHSKPSVGRSVARGCCMAQLSATACLRA